MKVGFIGLGTMGRGMAINLCRAGHEVIVYDLDPDAVTAVGGEGAQAASNPQEIAGGVEVLFTSLPGPAQVEAVILGADGIAETARDGLVLFELSTSSVSLVRRIHDELRGRGCHVLDAPVSGGPAGAAAGTLTLWVGGEREVFERHLQLLKAIGDKIRYVGDVGAGTVTKLAHNLVGYMMMMSLAEVFSMAVKAGMDPLELWQAMRLGLVGRGSALDMLTNQFLPGRYEPPAFALALAHKDVSLATALGKELGVPMRLANLTLEEMTEALGRGFGELDSRSFLKLQLERAGVDIAVDEQHLKEAISHLQSR